MSDHPHLRPLSSIKPRDPEFTVPQMVQKCIGAAIAALREETHGWQFIVIASSDGGPEENRGTHLMTSIENPDQTVGILQVVTGAISRARQEEVARAPRIILPGHHPNGCPPPPRRF